MSEELSHEEFVSLRKQGFKGIHTVCSGFNETLKKYGEGENPLRAQTGSPGRGRASSGREKKAYVLPA